MCFLAGSENLFEEKNTHSSSYKQYAPPKVKGACNELMYNIISTCQFISCIWGILQFTVGVLTLITGTVALDSMTLRYKISFAHCIFNVEWMVNNKKKAPTVPVDKRNQYGKDEAKNESSFERSLEYESTLKRFKRVLWRYPPMHQFGTDAAYNWNCGQAFYDTTVRQWHHFSAFLRKSNIFIWPKSDHCIVHRCESRQTELFLTLAVKDPKIKFVHARKGKHCW